jgi:PPOX class probable F420-dependent enzyme
MSEESNPTRSQLLSIDEGDDFGARAAEHLRTAVVLWLTTVSPSGVPTPNPIWFVWDGASTIRLFSMPSAARLRHLAGHPRVSLNFDGDGQGSDIVVLTGTAVADPQAPAADAVPDFVSKYAERIPGIDMTPAQFAAAYSVPITITLHRLRGF